MDLQRCASGEIVLYHDYDLERLGSPLRVEHETLSRLRQLDLGGGERIPTLDELLEDAPPELLLNLELKTERFLAGGIEGAVVTRIRAHAAQARVLVSSFNPVALWRVRRLAPELRIGFLFHGNQSSAWRAGWIRALRPDALHPEYHLVHAGLVRRARRRGMRIHTWTCNRPHSLRRLLGLGVDGIITNCPDLLMELTAAPPASPVGSSGPGRPIGP